MSNQRACTRWHIGWFRQTRPWPTYSYGAQKGMLATKDTVEVCRFVRNLWRCCCVPSMATLEFTRITCSKYVYLFKILWHCCIPNSNHVLRPVLFHTPIAFVNCNFGRSKIQIEVKNATVVLFFVFYFIFLSFTFNFCFRSSSLFISFYSIFFSYLVCLIFSYIYLILYLLLDFLIFFYP